MTSETERNKKKKKEKKGICSLGPSSSLLGESGSLKTVVVHHQDHLPLDHLLRFLKVVQRRICDISLDRVIENCDLCKQPA